MHVLLLIVGAVVAVAVWYWRFKMMREAASDAMDAAGKARGYVRRKTFARMSDHSPITAIEDPVVAAATLLHIVSDRSHFAPVSPIVSEFITSITTEAHANEAITFAEWAGRQVLHPGRSVSHLTEFLAGQLDPDEKDQLAAVMRRTRGKSEEAQSLARRAIARLGAES